MINIVNNFGIFIVEYKKGYKYQLHKDEYYQLYNKELYPSEDISLDFISLSTTGLLTLRKGYAWDGISGFPDLKRLQRGGALHDALYQLMRHGLINILLRLYADDEMYRVFVQSRVPVSLAATLREVVEQFGERYASEEHKKEVIFVQ